MKTAKHQHLTLQAARLADPNCSSPRWWQIAKEMCGLKGNSLRNIPPLADQSLGLVCEDHKKADLLNDTFINSNTSISQNSFPIGPTKLGSIFEFQELSSDDVKKAIRSLPNRTSTGPDRISYRLLKEAGPNVVGPLTTLYNYSLRMQQILEEWKMAVVTPIFKGGHRDREKPSNYRPISLTSCVARLMEKLLNAQILRYLEQSGRSVNLRTASCHGKKARCRDAIVRVVSRSISAKNLPKWTSKLSSRVEDHDTCRSLAKLFSLSSKWSLQAR